MIATPLRVLVIDDEPPIRKLLRMGLSTQGYEIPAVARKLRDPTTVRNLRQASDSAALFEVMMTAGNS